MSEDPNRLSPLGWDDTLALCDGGSVLRDYSAVQVCSEGVNKTRAVSRLRQEASRSTSHAITSKPYSRRRVSSERPAFFC